MRLPHHLLRSASGIYHFRLKVPVDLREAFGLRIVKVSLRTRDPRAAQAYAYALSLRYAQAFAARRETDMPKLPSPPIDDILAAAEEARARQYELTIDPTTRAFRVSTDGTAKDHERAMDALERIGVLYPHMMKPGYELPGTVAPVAAFPSMSLADAIQRYTEAEAPSLHPNTWKGRKRALKSFAEFMGEKTLVGSITRARAGEWGDSLINEKTTKGTAANQVSQVAQLFEMLIQRGVLPKDGNVVKGVVVQTPNEKRLRRAQGHTIEALPLDTLKRIFAPENFARIGTEHARWGSILGLYTGARVGELAQIYLRDFVEEEGAPCLRITMASDGQRLKTEASNRLVPLHPDLIRLGLMARVARLRKEGHERLFPGMRIDSEAGTGNAISKAFRYYLHAQLGVRPQRTNGTVSFHSLRKNVTQELQGSKLPAERRRAFVGHERGEADVHEVYYMRAWRVEELAELFPGLTWGTWLALDELSGLLR